MKVGSAVIFNILAAISLFQSPCGEVVMKAISDLIRLNESEYQRFSPLAGKW